MQNILESTVRIRFQDCDPFNHLNNICYLDYFLSTREEQLREAYNLDVFENREISGLIWLVASNQIYYLKPAATLETVIIDSQLIEKTPRSLMVEMRMWNSTKTQLKAFLWTEFIYYDLNKSRPALHSEELANLFENILLPVEQTSFGDRKNFLARKKH